MNIKTNVIIIIASAILTFIFFSMAHACDNDLYVISFDTGQESIFATKVTTFDEKTYLINTIDEDTGMIFEILAPMAEAHIWTDSGETKYENGEWVDVMEGK